MGLGSPGGAGPGGFGEGDSGSGGGGGGRGDGGYIGLDNPNIDPQAVQNDFMGINKDIDDAIDAAMRGEPTSKLGKFFGNVAKTLAGITVGRIGADAVGLVIDALQEQGVSYQDAVSMVTNVQRGMSPKRAASEQSQSITNSLRTGSGSVPQPPKEKYADPKGDDFWHDFVKEWQGAKQSLNDQQKFRQKKLQPAFDTYQQRLSGLSNEQGFKPINVGIGDFSTSFMPKRSTANAQSLLNSELAETDIMNPEGANLSYLDRLGSIAQFQQELKNRINVANIGREQPDDQGTWLDSFADIMKVGNQVGDAWERYSK
jgi:hypothetical protein